MHVKANALLGNNIVSTTPQKITDKIEYLSCTLDDDILPTYQRLRIYLIYLEGGAS